MLSQRWAIKACKSLEDEKEEELTEKNTKLEGG